MYMTARAIYEHEASVPNLTVKGVLVKHILYRIHICMAFTFGPTTPPNIFNGYGGGITLSGLESSKLHGPYQRTALRGPRTTAHTTQRKSINYTNQSVFHRHAVCKPRMGHLYGGFGPGIIWHEPQLCPKKTLYAQRNIVTHCL